MSSKRLSTDGDLVRPDAAGPDLATGRAEGVVAPEAVPTPQAATVDEHHGHGGEYQLVDGQRMLVHRTALA